MKSVILLFVLLTGTASYPDTDPGQLALALVDIARNDAGIGPNPTRGQLASGPFLIDSLTFALHFDVAFGTGSGATVIQTLANNGHSFGDHESLRRSETDANGQLKRTLQNDAIVLNLVALIRTGDEAIARLTMFYTEQNRRVCARTLEVVLKLTDTTSTLQNKKVIGDC